MALKMLNYLKKWYNPLYKGEYLMSYLQRKIDLFLEQWFNDKDKKTLIVKGARQIGKTESIRHFAKTHYSHIVK